VLAAAAELNLFSALAQGDLLAGEVAERLQTDPRGMRTLLDALVALGLLDRLGEHYHVPSEVADLMVAGRPGSQLAMAQHQANTTTLRRLK
jgi:DNA-binding IclR family transcriptional regulator